MSKSYFERRIFGQPGQSEESQENAPSLGSLKSAGADAGQGTTSQPYRFRASRGSEQPPISSESYERGSVGHGWAASDELRSRLGIGGHAPEPDAGPQWDAQTAQPAELARHIAEQEQIMDDLTGHTSSQEPYPLSAPQPSLAQQEPSFGFHRNEDFDQAPPNQRHDQRFDEHAMHAAPVATTATHAVNHGAAPQSAVTEPRMASASDVRVGERVNLSDQRSGSSVQPNLYVSADDRIGTTAQQGAPRRGPQPPSRGNPLAGAAAQRSKQQKRPQQPPRRKPGRGGAGAPPPNRRHRDGDSAGRGFFGWLRNGAMALALLFGVGLLMSVSYAALQGLRAGPSEDIPVLLAPETPVKLRPQEAGIDPNMAAGRSFEGDLTVLSNPRGVLEPSDDRFANDASATPTMTMNFGGQSLIIPQVDSAQPAVIIDPMASIIAASNNTDPNAAQPTIPGLTLPQATIAPTVAAEEPLAALAPLANGLRDLPIPNRRGGVPSAYKGLVVKVQATTSGAPATALSNSGTETALASGQRGNATATATIDPASGLPTTPQSPGLTGTAVVSPYGIQLASLRTEQQANVLWKRLQDKYPSLLGGLSSRIVRFDSGSRGVFYRLQAGPMPSKTTALDFCVQLKTAGQECIFVRG